MTGGNWSWPSEDPGAESEPPEPSPARPPVEEEAIRAGLGGAFELLGQLGQGGMGVVYRARDATGRQLAVKVCRDAQLSDRQRQRFEREGLITAGLNHPGILKIHSTGQLDGVPYLAYELVEDCKTLDEAAPSLSRERRVEAIRDAALALGHAHAQGVVHRDVKPENILLDGDGRVRVADFGLALAQGFDRMTRSGVAIGTPLFMAPEQAMARRVEIGPPTDVWALGMVLYQTLTEELPFDALNIADLTLQIERARIPSLRGIDPTISPDLEEVCLKALSRRPADRYPDGAAFAAELERTLSGTPVEARGEQRRRSLRRGLRTALLALGGVLLVLGGWALGRGLQGPSAAERARFDAIDEEAWALLRAPRSIASLEGELQALSQRAVAARLPSGHRASRRVATLRALLLHASGDEEILAPALAAQGEEATPARAALAGLLALETSPRQAVAHLDRAIGGGIGLLDLRAARALAQGRAGVSSAGQAQVILDDLERAGDLRRAETQDARARALLVLQRYEELAAALAANGGEPEDVLVQAVQETCSRRRPTHAALLLTAWPSERAFPEPPARSLLERCLPFAEAGLSAFQQGGELGQTIEWVEVVTGLDPQAPGLPFARAVVDGANICNRLSDRLRLTLCAAELAPTDYAIQRRATFTAAESSPRGSDVARCDAAIARALALAPDAAERGELACVQAWYLLRRERYAECLERTGELIAAAEHAQRRPELAAVRAMARRRLNQPKEALADADQGLRWLRSADLPRSMAPIVRAHLHLVRTHALRDLGQDEAAVGEAIVYLTHRLDAGGAVDELSELLPFLWDRRAEPGLAAPLTLAIERHLMFTPHQTGWWLRLALLQLEARDLRAAATSLEKAGDPPRRLEQPPAGEAIPPDLAGEPARLIELLHAQGGRAVLESLKPVVADLDRRRGDGLTP